MAYVLLIDFIERGWFTHLATNGAGVIHDWEFAFLGESSEDVAANLPAGDFGAWEETGHFLNLAINLGAYEGLGYGEAVGRMIEEERLDVPTRDQLYAVILDTGAPSGRVAAAADLLEKVSTNSLASGESLEDVGTPWLISRFPSWGSCVLAHWLGIIGAALHSIRLH